MEIKLQIISFIGVGRGGQMLGVRTIKKQDGINLPVKPSQFCSPVRAFFFLSRYDFPNIQDRITNGYLIHDLHLFLICQLINSAVVILDIPLALIRTEIVNKIR